MKRFYIIALVAGLVLAVGTAQAVVTSTVIDFRTGTIIEKVSGNEAIGGTPWLADNAGEWWDNHSTDPLVAASLPTGHKKINIGGMLVGGKTSNPNYDPQTLATDAPGVLPFLYDTNVGKAVTSWVFEDGSGLAALRLEIAGRHDFNELGIYAAGDKTKKKKLFPGNADPITVATFNPLKDLGSSRFGIYVRFERNGDTYYSESGLNEWGGTKQPDWWVDDTEKGYQHFALFMQETGGSVRWWLGVEDKGYGQNAAESRESDVTRGDYQDLVLTMQAIPDASTFALFLSGLPALALLRRRRG